jgi:hypothetical protein
MYLWIGLGFATFGLLVGTTAGLSSAQITTTLMGALFALIGGSIGVFLGKLDNDTRKLTGVALLAFSVFAMIGLYSGIYIRINDMLRRTSDPAGMATTRGVGISNGTHEAGEGYLKGHSLPLADYLKLQIDRDQITLAAACDQLREAKERSDGEKQP